MDVEFEQRKLGGGDTVKLLLLLFLPVCLGFVVIIGNTDVPSGGAVSPGSTNVVAWYDFDDTVGGEGNDDSHSTFDLATIGTEPTYTTGAVDYATCVSGAPGNAYTQATLDSSWGNSDADWSVAVRFRPQVSLQNNSDLTRSNASKWKFTYQSAGGGSWRVQGANVAQTGITSPTPATNTWYLLVIVHDGGAEDATYYSFDGAALSTTIGTGGTYGTGNMFIGAQDGTNTEDVDFDWIGYFDDQLTDDEISWLYNSGGTRAYSDL